MTNLITARTWANRNAAQWVLDMLNDETINTTGPQEGTMVCEQFANQLVARWARAGSPL